MRLTQADFHQAKRLYDAAERDWEFHDESKAFGAFMSWIEDNFEELLQAATAPARFLEATRMKTL